MKKENKIDTAKQTLNGSNLEPVNKPNYQKRADEASAFLKKNPPFEAIKAIENKRIKRYFEEGNSLEQIAVLFKLSEKEVAARLQELGLIETNACA